MAANTPDAAGFEMDAIAAARRYAERHGVGYAVWFASDSMWVVLPDAPEMREEGMKVIEVKPNGSTTVVV